MERAGRDALLGHLVDAVESVSVAHPIRVAIDGSPASGKTTLADELATALRSRGRHVIRASVDDFLRPRSERYRRGEFSGEGCYVDAHDHDAINRLLLDPLGPRGSRDVHLAVRDDDLTTPAVTAPDDSVLLFDGVFLLRPELNDRWDLRVLVTTAPETTVRRAVYRQRFASSAADVERRWRERYLPAQSLYTAAVDPTALADVVVTNDDPEHPQWLARVPGGCSH